MNCVGIDVSKGKSMIAVMRPFEEVVISPFEIPVSYTHLDVYKRQMLFDLTHASELK